MKVGLWREKYGEIFWKKSQFNCAVRERQDYLFKKIKWIKVAWPTINLGLVVKSTARF